MLFPTLRPPQSPQQPDISRACAFARPPPLSQVETVSKKDAMQFPLIGSAVLFGLYCVIKLVKKEYLDALISVYFALLGAFGIFGMISPPLTNALGLADLKRFEKSIHYKFWRARDSEHAEPIEISCSWWDAVLFLPCAGASIAYAVTKKWWLNNLLGCAFSVQGIEMLALGSYAIGCILLCGLFVYAAHLLLCLPPRASSAMPMRLRANHRHARHARPSCPRPVTPARAYCCVACFLYCTRSYDVFWVFGTEVMVSVAKGLNAPVKILFPKALNVKCVLATAHAHTRTRTHARTHICTAVAQSPARLQPALLARCPRGDDERGAAFFLTLVGCGRRRRMKTIPCSEFCNSDPWLWLPHRLPSARRSSAHSSAHSSATHTRVTAPLRLLSHTHPIFAFQPPAHAAGQSRCRCSVWATLSSLVSSLRSCCASTPSTSSPARPTFTQTCLRTRCVRPGAYPRALFASRASSAVFLILQPPTEGPARSKSHARSSVWA